MPTWGKALGAMAAVVVLVAAITVAVVQSQRLDEARQDRAALLTEREELQARVSELEDAVADAGSGAGPDPTAPDDPDPSGTQELEELLGGLEDLLGGAEGADGLEGLLEGLGDLEGMEDAQAVLACATPVEGVEPIPSTSLEQQVADVQQAVETIRGESFPEPLEPAFLTPEELADRLAEAVADDTDPDAVEADRRILSSLGAVPADIDLVQTQIDLLSAQVAGFYDTDTRELVVRADGSGEPLGVLELIALAHEMEHALADAVVGLPDLDTIEDDEDRLVAHLGAVEGDAVLLQTIFQAAAISPLDQLAAIGDPDLLTSQQALEEVPAYLAASLTWPYEAGPAFMCDVWSSGGWDAVDAVLQAPPAASVQVMYPERYTPGQDPPDLADPAAPAGFEPTEQRTFGAAQLAWLLEAPGDDPSQALEGVDDIADEWDAGEVHLFTRGADSVVALAFADRPGGESLCDALAEFYTRAVPAGADAPVEGDEVLVREGGGRVGIVTCGDDAARLAVGPDLATARTPWG